MQQRLGERDLSLAAVASDLFVSSRALQRAFAHVGSQGFRHELAVMRVTRAVQIFQAQPQLTVAQVASAVGYAHAPFFARTFRRQLGCAPGEWHRRCMGRHRHPSSQRSVGASSSSSSAPGAAGAAPARKGL